MSKKTFFITGIIVIIGSALIVFIFQRSNRISYDLAQVRRGDIVREVLASGKVESPTTVNLQFKNSERIIFLKTEIGQRVKAGEVLARQDTSSLNAQLNQLQATLKNQKYKLKSREENNIQNYDDKYDIKAQESLVKQAQADIEVQRAKINEAVLIAPIDGFIVAVNGEIGEIAKPEIIVVSIISDDKLQIDVDISETTIANIEIGQTVRVTLDAFEELEWMGRVIKIDPSESTKGGAIYYKTTVFFDKEDVRIKPGMTANVWVKTDISKDALFIPVSAVQKKDGKIIVKILQERKALEREVVTGLKNNAGMIEIVSGLSQSEQIILGTKK
jgi:RND family efflux transporter MFP subunit